jgi:hypothetical protein
LLKQSNDVIALSPDILGVETLIYREPPYNIDMVLATTPEYHNVLVTGLLSRPDVLETYPDLVEGLLKALHFAAGLVKFADTDVVNFAAGSFNNSNDRVQRALTYANDAMVFPVSLDVSEAHWINAARAFYDARDLEFTPERRQTARDMFGRHVQPYAYLARGVITEEASRLRRLAIADAQSGGIVKRRIHAALQSGLIVGGATLLLSGTVDLTGTFSKGVAATAAITGLAWLLQNLFGLERWTGRYFAHWALWILILGILLALVFFEPSHSFPLDVSVAIAVPIIVGLIETYLLTHNQ